MPGWKVRRGDFPWLLVFLSLKISAPTGITAAVHMGDATLAIGPYCHRRGAGQSGPVVFRVGTTVRTLSEAFIAVALLWDNNIAGKPTVR